MVDGAIFSSVALVDEDEDFRENNDENANFCLETDEDVGVEEEAVSKVLVELS